jgi:hypothetical protein
MIQSLRQYPGQFDSFGPEKYRNLSATSLLYVIIRHTFVVKFAPRFSTVICSINLGLKYRGELKSGEKTSECDKLQLD